MSKQLMDIVLPRLARPLSKQLERYWSGELNDRQFTRRFEELLRRQHAWLAKHGISDSRAAVTIHAALLVLSKSGLRAEAEEAGVPLEIIEFKAVREAASDVAKNYGVEERKVINFISKILSRYGNK
ncbi:MAG: hypothetical protein AB7P49_20805 [Bdellovibrionales bacterium]